ncbi:MAG: hypothetical protein ACXIUL_05200 [Wenzhouxiangella sp.]
MYNEWDGITQPDDLNNEVLQARLSLADAARSGDWPSVLDTLSSHEHWINCCRPGGPSQFSPLHQVAYAGAPVEVAERLIALGAFRTLENAQGQRAVDIAENRGHHHLREVLTPVIKHSVPTDVLGRIQIHFHEVIRGRIDSPLPNHGLRLPQLAVLLEMDRPAMWFPVPGMYGGFNYSLESIGADALLVVESWCRVVEGSGERHEITAQGSQLVDAGFV